jgi:hypothetical protein
MLPACVGVAGFVMLKIWSVLDVLERTYAKEPETATALGSGAVVVVLTSVGAPELLTLKTCKVLAGLLTT